MVLDTVYTIGVDSLAYYRCFFRVLHIYNALRKIDLISRDIPILEKLLIKTKEAAFYRDLM